MRPMMASERDRGNPMSANEQERQRDEEARSFIVPPEPQDSVLSTLNSDGSRRWLRPRLSLGRFLNRRRAVAWALILSFTAIPYLRIAGKPLILLDIAAREFTVLGKTFLPTDTIVLALFMALVFLSIFLITAVLGRVWCGWACPHTVYMEFLFRPIERFFDGPPRRGGRPGTRRSPLRTVGKYATYLAVSLFLAHTFLAYFVGVDALVEWVRLSPLEHPAPFLVMLATTGLMMFHFSYFREQLCIVACPYGRFQSVMLDRESLIVTYDRERGEPRGKHRKAAANAGVPLGDCVDCGLCVETCTTGIDIRDGLKMECVHCTQCIDACDAVMDQIGKPRGLVRYASQASVAGERRRRFRPRIVLYPLVMTALVVALVMAVDSKSTADVRVLRGLGMPYTRMDDGRISNSLRVKVVNRRDVDAAFQIVAVEDPDVEIRAAQNPFSVAPGESVEVAFLVLFPAERSASADPLVLRVEAADDLEFVKEIRTRLIGPGKPGGAQKGGSR